MWTHRISVDDPLYAALVRYIKEHPGATVDELEQATEDSPFDPADVEAEVERAVANADLVEANSKYWVMRYPKE